jgi:hypothetical protein
MLQKKTLMQIMQDDKVPKAGTQDKGWAYMPTHPHTTK